MKSRYWFISIFVLLLACSYLFYYFYEMERTRKIEEITGHQKIHARQAARGFYELFGKWNGVLFYLSKDNDIIKMNEGGKYELNTILGALKGEIKGITRTDKTGKIIYTTPYHESSIGADISKQKHMIQILSDYKPVVSDVFNAVQGFQAIVIHYPVFKDGEFDGTIAFLLDFRQIAKKILDEIKIGSSGYAWMLSRDGIELYCPVPGHVGKSINETAHGFPELQNLADKMLSGEEGLTTYSYNWIAEKKIYAKKIVYFLPIKINNTFWSLAVTYSEDEITASLKNFTTKLIIIFASVFLLGVFISYFGFKAVLIVKESEVRKKSEKILKESEERYRLISAAASDYMFSSKLEKDGSLIHNWVAGAFETITGYTFDEYISIGGWRAALHPDDREQDERDMQKLRNNQTVTSEVRTISKSGKIIWVSVSASPVWDNKSNTLIGITGSVRDITKRKLAEEALRLSEDKFEKAFRFSPDAISISSLKTGKLLEVNEGFERLFGYSREEAIGKTSLELNLYENPTDREVLMQKLKSEGRVNNFESIGRRKSGELRICTLFFELIYFMGEPCIVSTVHDITEQKRAEEALKESEFFLRKSQSVARIGSYYLDVKSGNWKSSPALDELFGIDKNFQKDVNGWLSLIHPDYKEEMSQYLIQHVITGHNRFEKEYKIIRQDNGQERWVFGHGELEFDKDGNTLAMIGTIQDITDRKLAEEELKKLYAATEQSPAAIAITNTKGIIEYINTTFTKISGFTLNEIKGKYLRILRPIKTPPENNNKIWNTIRNGSEWRGEYYNKRKDGTYYWESVLISPIKDDKGIITNFLSVQEDITEKKTTLGELILAKEKAEEAIKIKNVFLANMSHELRTPLIGILGYAEMLCNELREQEKCEMAKGIIRSGNRLLYTLNLILDLTRFESDRFELNFKNVFLADEINAAYQTFLGAALEKKLDFSIKILQDGLYAYIDDRIFRVVLDNLIHNAIKFTNTGSITIIAGKEENNKVFVSVKDAGIGIAKEHHEIIFEEFRQVSEGISRDYQGTGLGLSITKKYVEILGGKISLESQLGVGSTFTVRFPVVHAANK